MEHKSLKNDVKISNDVLTCIIEYATLDVKGVTSLSNKFSTEIREILGMKNLLKSIILNFKDNNLFVSININIKFGYNIYKTSCIIQEKVKQMVKNMTGINITQIDIYICNINLDKIK